MFGVLGQLANRVLLEPQTVVIEGSNVKLAQRIHFSQLTSSILRPIVFGFCFGCMHSCACSSLEDAALYETAMVVGVRVSELKS